MTAPVDTGWWTEWIVTDTEEQIHITPVDDLVGHDKDSTCPCGPYVEHLGGADWLYAHYALDGRE